MAHKEHVAHEKEHGEERKVYEYMNMRTKVSLCCDNGRGMGIGGPGERRGREGGEDRIGVREGKKRGRQGVQEAQQ